MNNELNDMYNELEKRLDNLTDDYLSGKIDEFSFIASEILTRLEKKLLPYHEELLKFEITFHSDVLLLKSLLSEKCLTPKKEQKIKEKLRKIKDIVNNLDSNKAEKEQAVASVTDKMNELLKGFFIILGDNNDEEKS